MARSDFTLTESFQQISTGRCVITMRKSGRYIFNDTASDTAAMRSYFKAGEQVVQNERITTHARSLDAGLITVDDEG